MSHLKLLWAQYFCAIGFFFLTWSRLPGSLVAQTFSVLSLDQLTKRPADPK